MSLWTPDLQAQASAQGWGLVDADGQLQLQRANQADGFPDDAAAAAFVKRQAESNDPLSQWAIAVLVNTDSPDVSLFNLQ